MKKRNKGYWDNLIEGRLHAERVNGFDVEVVEELLGLGGCLMENKEVNRFRN